jgi:hypothetical protein
MQVPPVLGERLGPRATEGLLELCDSSGAEWMERMLSVATDRFERRLTEELSTLRVEFHQGLGAVRQEVATSRVELLKWSFLFWVGQVAAIAGLLAFMVR